MPTPSTPDASDWRTENTVDLDEAARVVEAFIADGVDGILSMGTLGECGALSHAEKKAFMGCIAETARGRIPVFGGTTALGTRECVELMRVARDVGLDGTMCGPSMWNKPDVRTAAQFFRDIAKRTDEVKRRCRRTLQAQADALAATLDTILHQPDHVDPTLALV